MALTEECSAIIQNKLSPKLKDPGSFSITCVIGNASINRALCELGTSVSLMPMSICKKLGIGNLKPTMISLQLADRLVKYPIGILEDVPIQVGAIIDVKNGRFSLNIGGDVCYTVNMIDKCAHEKLANHYSVDSLEKCLVSDGLVNDEDPEVAAYAQSLESTSTAPLRNAKL
ncbi:uncharacterized protein LOC109831129 [Asparagus officinalis]|uniref:uncharacterized protein LOC109831129 n=1 Tax=Asparagus officinalis TaxID=4686 RepID=UPI00098E6684|nr:uncharacterized protein LOC109831129 [Asparagus officinalis]